MARSSIVTSRPPVAVEVGGATVPIRPGFRTGILAEVTDRRTAEGRATLLWAWYSDDSGRLPEEVSSDARAAFEAGSEWHAEAWRRCAYAGAAPRSRRRLLDLEADEGIVVADFQRLYGIDLTSTDTQMHWYRFVALLMGAVRTEGSLLGAAVAARAPMPARTRGEQRRRLEALARAWALPMTDDEAREYARRRF